MPSLIECVPNFSEGRRPEVVEEIVRAVRAIDGVTLLDYSRDETHNRSVVTFAGSAEPVVRAATAAVGRALELIDMEQQTGAHPRIGAVDVIPFVPLGATRMEECVDLARRFGEQIARTFELPVYLYGEAALRPERRRLADVRRGQYEGLKAEIGVDPDRDPDYGPKRMHPRGGAVAVGARKPLIAFNVNLASDDIGIARQIAETIRESSGGLPAVQAMAVLLENPGEPRYAQVSMNLVDWEQTGIGRVVDEIRHLARKSGVDIDHCELIGLAPAGALLEVAAEIPGAAQLQRRPGARAATGAGPMSSVRDALRAAVESARDRAEAAGDLRRPDGAAWPPVSLERPGRPEHGDYATNAAMQLAPVVRDAPMRIAEALRRHLGLPEGWRR